MPDGRWLPVKGGQKWCRKGGRRKGAAADDDEAEERRAEVRHISSKRQQAGEEKKEEEEEEQEWMLVCNLGDLMQRWSNDVLQSTPPRVVSKYLPTYLPTYLALSTCCLVTIICFFCHP